LARQVTVLGSTGSIGRQAMEVVRRSNGELGVFSLVAKSNVDRIYSQALEFRPSVVAMAEQSAAERLGGMLRDTLGADAPDVLGGGEAVLKLAADTGADVVLNAVVGSEGLLPSLAALDAGVPLALANKESLVMAGSLVMGKAGRAGALVPVDSEHSSLFRCLLSRASVRSVTLTASGGAFRDTPIEDMKKVKAEQALRHPVWNMGHRITIDSATMMNKALEVIEALHLFCLEPSAVHVVIHPQAYIHGLVELRDGTLLAHLGPPDMKTPIAYALFYPNMEPPRAEPLDLGAIGSLDFEKPDLDRFPCLRLGFLAAELGGTAPAVLNAADEVAVDAFLGDRIAFTDIADLVGKVLDEHRCEPVESAEQVIAIDEWARGRAGSLVAG
jgi:1-deoxy-D-xylulose-5-phosphate reductoisomerase